MKNKVLCIGTLVLIAFIMMLPYKVQSYEYTNMIDMMEITNVVKCDPIDQQESIVVRVEPGGAIITITQQIGLYLVIILAIYNSYKRVTLSKKIKEIEAEETKEENAENKLNTYKEEYRIHKQRTRIIITFAVLVIIYVFVTQVPRHF